MKTHIYSALVAMLTLVGSATAASKLTNVSLSYENGATVARIEVSGTIRFTHQTEIPKNGKPDRMILDVIGATNDFETKSFMHLPACGITGIRTSQYAVSPEKVVRLVFDMTKAPVYRVESDPTSIRVIFTDNTVKPFTAWTAISKGGTTTPESKPSPTPTTAQAKSAPALATPSTTPSVGAQNKTMEQDRQNSLASKPATTNLSQPAKSATTIAEKPKTEAPAPSGSVPATDSKPMVAVAPKSNTTQTSAPTVTTTAQKSDDKPTASTSPTATAYRKPTPAAAITASSTTTQTKIATAPSTAEKQNTPLPTDQKSTQVTVNNQPKPAASTDLAGKTPTQPKVEFTPKHDDAAQEANRELKTAAKAVTPATTTSGTPTETQNQTKTMVSNPAVEAVVSGTPTTQPLPATNPPSTAVVTIAPAPGKPSVSPDAKAETKALSSTAGASSSPAPTPKVSVTYTPDDANVVKTDKPQAAGPIIATSTTAKKLDAKTDETKLSNASPSPVVPTPPAFHPPMALPTIEAPKLEPPTPTVIRTDSAALTSPSAEVSPEGQTADQSVSSEPSNSEENSLTPTDTTTSTSRFRRSPEMTAKIKGTMIAEFPKRLVIKYDAGPNRDPFATLIDNTRTFDSPIGMRIPNVEGLKLVGILQSNTGDNRALFEDKKSYSYILKSGDKVQKGNVLRVEKDRVFFQIFEYGWTRTIALTIDDNQGQ